MKATKENEGMQNANPGVDATKDIRSRTSVLRPLTRAMGGVLIGDGSQGGSVWCPFVSKSGGGPEDGGAGVCGAAARGAGV